MEKLKIDSLVKNLTEAFAIKGLKDRSIHESDFISLAIEKSFDLKDIECLLKNGYSPNVSIESKKWSPLINAVATKNFNGKDKLALVNLLIDNGAETGYQSSTFSALSLCSSYGLESLKENGYPYIEIAELIIDKSKVDKEILFCESNSCTFSPLLISLESEFYKMADLLIANKVNINHMFSDQGMNALHIVSEKINTSFSKKKNTAEKHIKSFSNMMNYLIENGSDVMSLDNHNLTIINKADETLLTIIKHAWVKTSAETKHVKNITPNLMPRF